MTLSKSVTTILSNKSATAAGSTTLSDCTTIDTDALIALAIEARMTVASGATSTATIKVFASNDDSTWDTIPVEQFDMTLTASATIGQTFSVLPSARFLKVQVTNNDGTAALSAIYVYAHKQAVS